MNEKCVIRDVKSSPGINISALLDLINLVINKKDCTKYLIAYFPHSLRLCQNPLNCDIKGSFTDRDNILDFSCGDAYCMSLLIENSSNQINFFRACLYTKSSQFLEVIGPDGLSDKDFIEKTTLILENYAETRAMANNKSKCLLFFGTDTHLGHHILNRLGPAKNCCDLIKNKRIKGVSVALLEGQFFSPDFELSLLGGNKRNVRVFKNKKRYLMYSQNNNLAVFKIKGAEVTQSINQSVLNLLKEKSSNPKIINHHSLTIGVGLRVGSRQAINIKDCIEDFLKLQPVKNFKFNFIFDGLGQSSLNSIRSTALLSMSDELDLANECIRLVESYGHVGYSIVGLTIEQQLLSLYKADFIIGHQGSSSSKYMWLLGKTTVIHGPFFSKSSCYTSNLEPVGLDFANAYRFEKSPKELRILASSVEKSVNKRSNYYIDKKDFCDTLLKLISG